MNTTRTAAVLAGLGLVLSLSACSSSDTADANAAYCEGASKIETEVQTMETLIGSSASADAVKAQWGAVQAAIEAKSVPLTQLEDAVQEDVSAAYDTFTTAIEAIPADIPPSEAAPQYKAAIDGFTTATEAVKSEVGCS
jgi:Cys-tRNA synthase (O-phospho-L-seryl-tRNA:Cys-tRNA synthase)